MVRDDPMLNQGRQGQVNKAGFDGALAEPPRQILPNILSHFRISQTTFFPHFTSRVVSDPFYIIGPVPEPRITRI